MVCVMLRESDHAVAGAWGFAEATFFFVVPDVWTTWVAVRRPERALATCVSALAGALAGGVVTYLWGQRVDAAASKNALVKVPAITAGMVDQVEADLNASGHLAMMSGPVRGVPYKLYARASGLQRRSLAGFLAWSVPARMIRFVALTQGSVWLTQFVRRYIPQIPERLITLGFVVSWTGFYAWFVPTMSRRR